MFKVMYIHGVMVTMGNLDGVALMVVRVPNWWRNCAVMMSSNCTVVRSSVLHSPELVLSSHGMCCFYPFSSFNFVAMENSTDLLQLVFANK